MKRFISPSYNNGSARFMSGWDKYILLNRWNKGLTINGKRKISRKESYNHSMTLGRSGSGKSQVVFLPNLMNLSPKASCIVFDPSLELYEKTHKYLSRTHEIKVLHVTDLDISERYNPLANVSTKSEIRRIAQTIITAAFGDNSKDAFWNNAASGLLYITCLAVKKLPEAEQNLEKVYSLLNKFHEPDTLDDLMSQALDDKTFDEYASFCQLESKMKSSVISTARTSINLMSDDDLAELCSESTLDFKQFRKSPHVLYIVVPEHLIEYYRFYLCLLLGECFETFIEMPSRNDLDIIFLLDEFSQLGRILAFEKYLTVLRKRRCSISICIQDLSQLEIYGNFSSAILNGCGHQLYLPGLGIDASDRVAKLLGEKFVENSSSRSKSKNQAKEPLFSAAQIRTLKKGYMIYIPNNNLGL